MGWTLAGVELIQHIASIASVMLHQHLQSITENVGLYTGGEGVHAGGHAGKST